MSFSRVARLALGMSLPVACTQPGEAGSGEGIREDPSSIVGSAARADTTHSAVVAIVSEQGSLCTGTAVRRSPDGGTLYVLTAAHCCPGPHEALALRIGADYAEPSRSILVESSQRHPCYNPLSDDYDFCVLKVPDRGELNLAPMPLASPPDDVTVGSPITFVGYGSTPAVNTIRRRVEGKVGSVAPLTIGADQTNGLGGICFGDSGGPALVTENGVEVIAGVNAFVAPTSLCDVVGVAGRVAFRGVRDEFLDKALAGGASPLQSLVIQRRGPTPGAVRDTTLESDEPARPFGSRVELLVGTPPGTEATRRALVRFDLSGIPAGATILSARVGLHAESRTGPGTIEVHRVTKDWDEATETWASFGEDGFDPAVIASSGNATAIVMSSDQVWFDITPPVVDWFNGTVPDHGLMLTEPDRSQTQLLSSEIGRVGERPWLHVCYLPKQP